MVKQNKLLKKNIERLCKEIIYIRDGGKCQKCGKPVSGKNAHTSHVIPKSHGNGLRFDLLNLKLLCFHCHINWWHKNPLEAAEWFKSKYPKRWEYLEKNKEHMVKLTISDFQIIYEVLEKHLEELSGR